MDDLFSKQVIPPLAELLRPKSLSDIVGQEHLLNIGRPLRVAIETQYLHSMIFWGPPGVGKTTLARLTASSFGGKFITLSATSAGVKEIRQAVETARLNRMISETTILFIDEIHRFNKAQQDALLPDIESGMLIFIGATTENPSFEVNAALLSRATVYILKSLSDADLHKLLVRVQKTWLTHITFERAAASLLVKCADGDARRLLNFVEHAAHAARIQNKALLDVDLIEKLSGNSLHHFDKHGDAFYDQISALHKTVRGSDPDAALYWLSRMLVAGIDAKYLSRRIIRMAWEDVGLADPRAIQIVLDAAQTYERLGSPEGDLALAQAVIYLSVAPKSNAGYSAFNQAMEFVKKDISREVPQHLKNAPTQLMKGGGFEVNYRYGHNEKDGLAIDQNYLPDGMVRPSWYHPVSRGLESKIAEKLRLLNDQNQKITHQSDSSNDSS